MDKESSQQILKESFTSYSRTPQDNMYKISDGSVLTKADIVDILLKKKSEQTPIRLHPLGFLQIPLIEGSDRNLPGPRINIWPETSIHGGGVIAGQDT